MTIENRARWHQKELGARFVQAEKDALAEKLLSMCGYHLLFMGDRGLAPLVFESLISHRIVLSQELGASLTTSSTLQGAMEAIALQSDSVDVVVLCHVLEHIATPHAVLREVHRVLIPQGHVLITGFNPFSLWGLWHIWQKLLGHIPLPGKMLSINRMRDWLRLLNFEIVEEKTFYFRPPFDNQRIQEKLGFLEKWGKMLWPFWGGGYALVAAKQVISPTPVRPRWREKPLWQPGQQPSPTLRDALEDKK